MTTKRLERTVIEGGRNRYNQFCRNHTHREERAEVRAFVAAILRDLDAWDDAVAPARDRAGRAFYDKLSAAERWLAKRVGKPWRCVEGEVLATFDTRTLAGRHIVFDHLLPRGRWTARDGWPVRRLWFHVDAKGFLRARPRAVWRNPLVARRASIEAFLDGRQVVVRGAHAYWLVATSTPVIVGAPVPRRQGRALTAAERAVLATFDSAEREAWVVDGDAS